MFLADQAWLMAGRANFILDNLIAAGKAKPVVVVMPNGNATQTVHYFESAFGMTLAGFAEFVSLIEFFQCIAAGGVEQAIEHFFIADLDVEQRLGDQLRDRSEDFVRLDVLTDDDVADYERKAHEELGADCAKWLSEGLLAR